MDDYIDDGMGSYVNTSTDGGLGFDLTNTTGESDAGGDVDYIGGGGDDTVVAGGGDDTVVGGGDDIVDSGFGTDGYANFLSQFGFEQPQDWQNFAKSGETIVGNYTDTQVFDDGSTLITDKSGNIIGSTPRTDGGAGNRAGVGQVFADLQKQLGNAAYKALKDNLTTTGADGKKTIDWAKLGTAGAGLYTAAFGNKKDGGGYQKPVPKMEMVREQIQYNDVNRRPGEGGRQYFTDPRFVTQGGTPDENAAALTAAKNASTTQATGIKAAYTPATVKTNPYASSRTPAPISIPFNPKAATTTTGTTGTTGIAAALPVIPSPEEIAKRSAENTGIASGITLAAGGQITRQPRYLQGKTDGMADKVPSKIDGKQPAALSHGEFVIPADVVSHLGNGNSDAGAQKLYQMMDRIRHARTGTKEQGKQINPDKFLMGGLASAYAAGGQVQRFNAGGGVPLDVSKANTLSPYVGEYVTGALGEAQALASAPYQAYQGPLTAGASNLQQQAFAGASDLASAGYTPGSFAGGFGAAQATQYMNPYLQASLDPQLKELRRQSDIQRMADAGRLTKAGAFGGGRQAIMESEGNRNLLDKQEGVLAQGYKSAYDAGLGQFNKERESDEASRQFSANFGLKSVGQLADLGATERGITSEGIEADKKEFEKQRDYAYSLPGYKLGLLQGLPIGTQTTSTNQDELSKIQTTLANLGVALNALGVTRGATTT
jgi:hypothetical protein